MSLFAAPFPACGRPPYRAAKTSTEELVDGAKWSKT